MVVRHFVDGYANFKNFMKDLKSDGKIINILFTGKKNEKGESWCPDCVAAEPFIETAITKYAGDSLFITVDVGDRATWKDMNCSFRKDHDTHLQVIPTLVRWKNPQRLEGPQLENDGLLEMFFTDE